MAWCDVGGKSHLVHLRRMVPFILIWEIWLERNRVRHNEDVLGIDGMLTRAMAFGIKPIIKGERLGRVR